MNNNTYPYRDNVQWDEDQERVAKEKVEQNSQVTFSEDHLESLENDADKHWDAFYDIHQNRYGILPNTNKIIIPKRSTNIFLLLCFQTKIPTQID